MNGRETNKVTAEFYSDPLLVNLVGAVDVPAKRMIEAAQTIGKTICRVIHADTLETSFVNAYGERIDQILVHR